MRHERVACHWHVADDMHGLRADIYLLRRIGRISRMRAQRIIEASDFLLDDAAVKVSKRVKAGQKVTLWRFAPDHEDELKDIKVEICYEDEHILVINKPANLSVHPSANCLYKTFTHWLRINRSGFKINPCHRLDKETSGLLLAAKDRAVERILKKAFMSSKVKKAYIAIVDGHLKSSLAIKKPLALQGARGLVKIKMIEDLMGQAAITRVRPLFYDSFKNRTLVMCIPKTGRQHQIRAHLALSGFPIVGDKLYGHTEKFFDDYCKKKSGIEQELIHPRHALHARALSFSYGSYKKRFRLKLPADFYDLITIKCSTL